MKFDKIQGLIEAKEELNELRAKVNMLKRLVMEEEADRAMQWVRSDYGDVTMGICGEVLTRQIREIFGWRPSSEAYDILSAYWEARCKRSLEQ